jgi:hypothetical protein
MARVVPSELRDLIDSVFNRTALSSGIGMYLNSASSTQLASLLSLAERMPDELLTLPGRDYCNFVLALETIRHQLSRWLQGNQATLPLIQGNRNVVLVIYDALKLCADQAPAAATTELLFILDDELRDSIRLDISSATRDLINGEWKGATVLAGAATEALLLWALQNKDVDLSKKGRNPLTDIAPAIKGAVSKGRLRRLPGTMDPEDWHLREYIETALELKLISMETSQQARLANDFRNFIHPGEAARTGQKCDLGTAHGAMASVGFVVRDLS